MALFVSSHLRGRINDRLFSVSATFRRYGQSVVRQSTGWCFSPSAAGNRRRQGQVFSARNFRIPGERGFATPLPLSVGSISEQYPGARSPRYHEKDAGQAAFSAVQLCAEDDSRLRGDAQDSEGTAVGKEARYPRPDQGGPEA